MDVRGRALVLNLTHGCNLRCKYCFVEDRAGVMSPGVVRSAQRAITWDGSGPRSVSFFGGEPLLCFDVLQEACEVFDGAQFTVTTNGTLITDDMVAFFKAKKFRFIVSLDGNREQTDEWRGEGTYEKVLSGLLKLRDADLGKYVTIRATYPLTSPDIAERLHQLSLLCDKGLAGDVAMCPMILDGRELGEEEFAALAKEHRRASLWVLDRLARGNKAYHRILWKFVKTALLHERRVSHCGGGVRYFTVGPDGSIFACHREGDSKVGDVESGLDLERCKSWGESAHVDDRTPCKTCGAAYMCGGACRYASICTPGCNGDKQVAEGVECQLVQYLIREAWWLVSNPKSRQLMGKWLGLKMRKPPKKGVQKLAEVLKELM